MEFGLELSSPQRHCGAGSPRVALVRILEPSETRPGEQRVAIVPQVVAKFTALGFEVHVQSGAGHHAFASDDAYRAAGATVIDDDHLAGAFESADVIASVRPLDYPRASRLRKGTVTVSFLSPVGDIETIRGLRDAGRTGLSFAVLPRIPRKPEKSMPA